MDRGVESYKVSFPKYTEIPLKRAYGVVHKQDVFLEWRMAHHQFGQLLQHFKQCYAS